MKAIRAFWKYILSVLLGIAVFALAVGLVASDIRLPTFDFLMNGLMSVSSTLSGFLITIAALLLSIKDSSVMLYIHKHKWAERELYGSVVIGFVQGVALLIISLLTGGQYTSCDKIPRYLFASIVGLGTTYFVSIIFIFIGMLRILYLANRPDN